MVRYLLRKKEENKMKNSGPGFGLIWFIGWLFTIGYAELVWWKIILGIVVWPFYLGQVVG
jgi:hypothetical protein